MARPSSDSFQFGARYPIEILARDKNLSLITKKNSIVKCPGQARSQGAITATKRVLAGLPTRGARRTHRCAINYATIAIIAQWPIKHGRCSDAGSLGPNRRRHRSNFIRVALGALRGIATPNSAERVDCRARVFIR
jgi:hypothetical protein